MERDLTSGSIGKTLVLFALPIMAGFALQTAFNIIDTFFIGMLGPEELAAVSITFPVVFIFIALASGLSIGTMALVSHAVGAKKIKEAGNIAEHSLLLALAVGLVVAFLGISFSAPLFGFMGATGEVIPLTKAYSDLIFIGFVFLFIGFIGQGILQAGGNSTTPLKFNFIAVVLNIALDAVLIFGLFGFPRMEIVGAALATVISRSIGAGLIILYLVSNKSKIKLCPKSFRFDFGIMRRIISIGTPSSLGQSITSIGMVLLMSIVGAFGTFAIAALGIGMRLDSLAFLPVIGLASATISVVGQNLGARNIERAKETISIAAKIAIILSLIVSVFFLSFPAQVFSVFSSSAEVVEIGTVYLSIVALSYGFSGMLFIYNAGFQGAKRTGLSAGIILFMWTLSLSVSFALSRLIGLHGAWYGALVSFIAAAMLAFAILKSGYWLKK